MRSSLSRSLLSQRLRPRGLTLLELLLGMVVLSIIMITIGAAMSTMQNTWVRMREKSDTYRSTRMALDNMSRRLAQATLATRWVQDEEAEPNSATEPFKAESDLHFVSGPVLGENGLRPVPNACGHAVFFQAPLGETAPSTTGTAANSNQDYNHLTDTLCAWGYYVEYGEDQSAVPSFIRADPERSKPRRRFRLMEFRQPASEFMLYQTNTDGTSVLADSNRRPPDLYNWFRKPLEGQHRPAAVVAENVIAVVISPFDPQHGDDIQNDEAPHFRITRNGLYDTRRALWDPPPSSVSDTTYTWQSLHHLPPALRLSIIATSEDSWERLINRQGEGLTNANASRLQSAINSRFTTSEPLALKRDLDAIEDMLNDMKIDHRVFTIDIRLSEQ